MARAQAMEDGGGRELAYVKMSRAKERSGVYVVADSLEQAKEDLRREWGTDRRLGWVIDTGTPMTNPLDVERSPSHRRAPRRRATAPPSGPGTRGPGEGRRPLPRSPVAAALRELDTAETNVARLERNLAGSGRPRKDRRAWRAELEGWRPKLAGATRAVTDLTGTELARPGREEHGLQERLTGLGKQQETYRSWTALHPEAARRLDHLAGEIASVDEILGRSPPAGDLPRSLQPDLWSELARTQERSLGLDLGR